MALTKEQIKEFEEKEKEAEDYEEFKRLADGIADFGDGDLEWARKVYKKAEEKAKKGVDFCKLADSLYEKLSDKEWALKNYIKADKIANECDDYDILAWANDKIEEINS
jgi:hypothetical protein